MVYYEWDPQKEKINFEKHGVHFWDAQRVFQDPFSLQIKEQWDNDEQRFLATGLDRLMRITTVVYTYRKEKIRIISARKASKQEREIYESRAKNAR